MKKILIFSLLLIPLLFSSLQGQTSQYYIEQIDSAVTDVRDRLWEGYTLGALTNYMTLNTSQNITGSSVTKTFSNYRTRFLGKVDISYLGSGEPHPVQHIFSMDSNYMRLYSNLISTGDNHTELFSNGATIYLKSGRVFGEILWGAVALTVGGSIAIMPSTEGESKIMFGTYNTPPLQHPHYGFFPLNHFTFPKARGNIKDVLKMGTSTDVVFSNFVDLDSVKSRVLSSNKVIEVSPDRGYYAFEDVTTILSIITQNSWYHVTNLGNNLFSRIQDSTGFAISGDTLIFISNHAADTNSIKFIWAIEGGGIGGQTYEFRLYNVTKNSPVIRKAGGTASGSTSDMSIGTLSYATNVSYGDRFILQVRNIIGTGDFTARRGSIYAEVSSY